MSKEFYSKLAKIQRELNAPKNQRNNFGGYNYRSCEDILEAVKPLLGDLFLSISDEILLIGDRYYVKATATITDGESSHIATALAREEQQKKGMDASQLTGATSSYARKYCLNGLFGIDDNKDADATNDHGKGNQSNQNQYPQNQQNQRPQNQRQSQQVARNNQQGNQQGQQQQRQQSATQGQNGQAQGAKQKAPQTPLECVNYFANKAKTINDVNQLNDAYGWVKTKTTGSVELDNRAEDIYMERLSQLTGN